MKRKRLKISSSDRVLIETAVKLAEKETSGEIVPFIVSQSASYLWVPLVWAGIGWLLSSLFVWAFYRHYDWGNALLSILSLQCVGIILGFFAGLLPPFKRLLLSHAVREANVHREVLSCFVRAGVGSTKDRTGVLIYLSILERRVEILADRGIYEKVSENYWEAQVKKIVSGIHNGSPVEILCEVIGEVGKELAYNFPAHAGDSNELSDELHTDI